MSGLRKAARFVRHLPALERADWLWSLLRSPYHAALNLTGGARIRVGGVAPIVVPAEFSGGMWEAFEREAVAAFTRWVESNHNALVLDIGCSHGVYSAVALSVQPGADVIAFDADLPSLAQTRRLCARVSGDRLRLLWGLVGERSGGSAQSLAAALEATRGALARGGVSGDWGTTRYVCIGAPGAQGIPKLSLDALFPGPIGRPVLIKCDIEGAELLMLRGAEELLRRDGPQLLLSVHPDQLPAFGHGTEDVQAFLLQRGYAISRLETDHEEHWWCSIAR